jgi:hypothetical protein
MNSLKAWVQDPEDWKIKQRARLKRKSFIQKLIPWLIAAAIPLALMLINWGVEKICS